MEETQNTPVLVKGIPPVRGVPATKRTRKQATPTPPNPPPEEPDDPGESNEQEEERPRAARRTASTSRFAGWTSPITLRERDEDFWSWLRGIEPNIWDHALIAYLWRTAPIIDNSFGGRPVSIRKITTPFDIEKIRDWEGSGGYRIDLSAICPETRKQKRIEQQYFEILDPDYAPRIPEGPWMEAPENRKWSWVKAVLAAKAANSESNDAGRGSGPHQTMDAAAIVRETIKGMTAQQSPASTALMDKALQMLDPSHQFTMLERLSKIGGNNNGSGSETLEIVKLMLSQSEARAARFEAQLLAMQQRENGGNQRSLIQMMREQVELKNLASELAGDRPEPDLATRIFSGLADALPKAIDLLTAKKPTPAPAAATAAPGQPVAAPATPPEEEDDTVTATLMIQYGPALAKHQPLLRAAVSELVGHFKYKEGTYQNRGRLYREAFLESFNFPDQAPLTRDQRLKLITELASDLPIRVLVALIDDAEELQPHLNPPENVSAFLEGLFNQEANS